YGPEMVSFAFDFYAVAFKYNELEESGKLNEELTGLINGAKSFFKNYNAELDRKIFTELTPLYVDYVDNSLLPQGISESWQKTSESIFEKSIILNQEKLEILLSKFTSKSAKKLQKDPAVIF